MPDALLTLNQTLDGQYAANVLGFNNITDNPAQLQEVADEIRDTWETYLVNDLSTLWSLDSITFAFLLDSTIDYSVEVAFTQGPLVGGNTADILPTQTALLVSTTFVGSAPNRGRIYLMGFCENATSNNVWLQSAVASASAVVTTLVNGIATAPNTTYLRIIGRPIEGKRPTYVSSPVDVVTPRGRIATIRGRRRGT